MFVWGEIPLAVTAARTHSAGQGKRPGTPTIGCGFLGAWEQQPQPGQAMAAF